MTSTESPVFCPCNLPHSAADLEAIRKAKVAEIKCETAHRAVLYWGKRPEQKRMVDALAVALWPE